MLCAYSWASNCNSIDKHVKIKAVLLMQDSIERHVLNMLLGTMQVLSSWTLAWQGDVSEPLTLGCGAACLAIYLKPYSCYTPRVWPFNLWNKKKKKGEKRRALHHVYACAHQCLPSSSKRFSSSSALAIRSRTAFAMSPFDGCKALSASFTTINYPWTCIVVLPAVHSIIVWVCKCRVNASKAPSAPTYSKQANTVHESPCMAT